MLLLPLVTASRRLAFATGRSTSSPDALVVGSFGVGQRAKDGGGALLAEGGISERRKWLMGCEHTALAARDSSCSRGGIVLVSNGMKEAGRVVDGTFVRCGEGGRRERPQPHLVAIDFASVSLSIPHIADTSSGQAMLNTLVLLYTP